MQIERQGSESELRGKEPLLENVIRIEKPEGVYRLVLSSSHNKQESVDSVQGSDAVILEESTNYSDPEFLRNAMTSSATIDPQYKDIIQWSKENSKAVYFTDIQDSYVVSMLQKILRAPEAGAAFFLLAKLGVKLAKKESMQRRDFLKFAAGAYLASPIVENLMRIGQKPKNPEHSTMSKATNTLGQLNESIHPETQAIITTLRNHLMAQKWKTVMYITAAELKGKKPEVAQVVGGDHANITVSLDKNETERAEVIRKLLSLPGREEDRKKIATIARADYIKEKDEWRVREYTDPVLMPLEK